jgi:putative ATP-dependent endonuclease of the OLD family
MPISKLHVENFRSIESLDLELPQLCALVGPNNAGKSNIMVALYRVLGDERGVWANRFDDIKDRYRHDPDRDIEITLTLNPPVPYKKYVGGPTVDIHAVSFTLTRYQKGEKTGQARLVQECRAADDKAVQVLLEAPKKGEQHKVGPLVGIPKEVQRALPLIYVKADRRLEDQLPGSYNSVLRRLFEDIDADFHDEKNEVDVKRADGSKVTMPRSKRWRELMTAAMHLLRTDEFASLERDINQNALRQLGFDPDEDELKLHFDAPPTLDFYKELELRVTESGLTVDATELGQGFQNAVFLAVMEAYEKRRKKGAIFLIEEPEISLHPQTQRALYGTLRSISAGNQVIYATHSPHFVGIPDFETIRLVQRQEGKTSARRSTLTPSQELTEKLRKEVDPERGELFFARRLLVVEGDTEKLSFPEYAARLPLDLDRAGATIVEAGGKSNLLPIADVAASFGIPTGIIYDRDAGSFKDQREEEEQLNKRLAAFEDASKGMRAWCLAPDYEAVLRATLGDEAYQAQCQKHSGVTKAVRARLIASDTSTATPPYLEEALRWVSGDEGRRR